MVGVPVLRPPLPSGNAVFLVPPVGSDVVRLAVPVIVLDGNSYINIALIGTSANPKERPPVALCWSTGRLTSEPVDEKMARNTKSKPNAEVKVSIALLEIFGTQ